MKYCKIFVLQSRSQLTQLYDKLRITNTGLGIYTRHACCIGVPNICWAAIEYERDINAGDCDPSGRGAGLTAGSTSITRIEIVSLSLLRTISKRRNS